MPELTVADRVEVLVLVDNSTDNLSSQVFGDGAQDSWRAIHYAVRPMVFLAQSRSGVTVCRRPFSLTPDQTARSLKEMLTD